MTCRIIGAGCVHGKDCNPGKPARPVYMDGNCWPCYASGRVTDGIASQHVECCVCGGDPRGGEVQPVFGDGQECSAATGHASLPEPLLFCVTCSAAMRAHRAAEAVAAPIDALELWAELATYDPEQHGEAA